MPSPITAPLTLTEQERSLLQEWAHDGAGPLSVRALVILRCAQGGTIGDVAHDLALSRHMVSKWRSRFLVARLEGLRDEPRSGRPRRVGPAQVDLVLTTTRTQDPPSGRRSWSTRLMAERTGVPAAAVARIWREHPPQPADLTSWPPAPGHRIRPGAALGGLLLAPSLAAVALLAPRTPAAPAGPAAHSVHPARPVLPVPAVRPAQTGSRPWARPGPSDAVRNRLPHFFRLLESVGAARAGRSSAHGHRPREDVVHAVLGLLGDVDAVRPADAELQIVSDSAALFGDSRVSGWIVRRPRVQVHLLRPQVTWPVVIGSCLTELMRHCEHSADSSALLGLEAAAMRWSPSWRAGGAPPARPFSWVNPAAVPPNF